jgi:hypothetical protein
MASDSAYERKIIIHAGYPKTASTALQLGLYQSREILKKVGVELPEVALDHHSYAGKHHITELLLLLGNSNRSDRQRANPRFSDPQVTLQLLQRELRDLTNCTVILSDEACALLPDESLLLLREILADWHVQPVFYLRRQDKYLQSMWAQAIKIGISSVSFDAWMEAFLMDDPEQFPTAYDPNYMRTLQRWEHVFGRDNMFVRPFEAQQLRGNILEDFLSILGVDASQLGELLVPHDANQSPSIKTLEVVRQLLAYMDQALPLANQRKQQLVSILLKSADDMGWNSERLNLVDKEKYERLMSLYDPINQQVAERYLQAPTLFKDTFKHSPLTRCHLDSEQQDYLRFFEHTLRYLIL